MKKIYKSDKDKVLAGVIGGIGEYFEIDPTILRLGFILVTIMTGVFPAIIAYGIAVLVVPNKFHSSVEHMDYTEKHEHKEEPKSE